MVELLLPKNSRVEKGKVWPKPAGRDEAPRVPGLSLRPRHRRQSAARHLLRRSRRLRPDGPRRPALDQEQGRPHADPPPLVPRGHLRLVLDEHRRPQHPRLHQGDGGHFRRGRRLSAAPHAGDQGPRPRPDDVLRPAPRRRALAQDHDADAQDRVDPVRRRARKARRALRVHPLRLLLDLVPELLVERRDNISAPPPCSTPTAG